MASHIDHIALEDIPGVVRVQRIRERVFCPSEVVVIVLLDRRTQERQPNEEQKDKQGQESKALRRPDRQSRTYSAAERAAGFQRTMGLRAAVTSSTRLVRVRCGADLT